MPAQRPPPLPSSRRPGRCPACGHVELDLAPGDRCPECGGLLVGPRGFDFTSSAAAGWLLDLAVTTRLAVERAWGGELLTVLAAVSLATVTASLARAPLPDGVAPYAGALAGGLAVGVALARGAAFYALAGAGIMALSLRSSLTTAAGLTEVVLLACCWTLLAAVASRAVSSARGIAGDYLDN